MRYCDICGKSSEKTRIIHSPKYEMDLCKYHHEMMSRKHLDADNNINGDIITVDGLHFTFDCPVIIRQRKWHVKYILTALRGITPYLADSSGRLYVKKITGCTDLDRIVFLDDNPCNCRKENIAVASVRPFTFKPSRSSTGYTGLVRTGHGYRYDRRIEGYRFTTRTFKRLEPAVYFAYLIGLVVFNDTSLYDDTTKRYLSKLNITDKEEILSYFKKKVLPLNTEYRNRFRNIINKT